MFEKAYQVIFIIDNKSRSGISALDRRSILLSIFFIVGLLVVSSKVRDLIDLINRVSFLLKSILSTS